MSSAPISRAVPGLARSAKGIDAFRVESDDTEDITAWQDGAEALATLGADALVPLRAAMADENANVRAWSTDALGQLDDSRALEPLLTALHDGDHHVRYEAAAALGKFGGAAAVEALVGRLHDLDEDPLVRMTASRALGHLVRGELFPPLVAALDDSDIEVRCQVLWAIAASGGAHAVETLLAHTRDSEPCVRHAAVHGLAEVGDVMLLPLLEQIEREDNGACRAVLVRDAARYASERIRLRYGRA
jgi:HEAT repeat protein